MPDILRGVGVRQDGWGIKSIKSHMNILLHFIRNNILFSSLSLFFVKLIISLGLLFYEKEVVVQSYPTNSVTYLLDDVHDSVLSPLKTTPPHITKLATFIIFLSFLIHPSLTLIPLRYTPSTRDLVPSPIFQFNQSFWNAVDRVYG